MRHVGFEDHRADHATLYSYAPPQRCVVTQRQLGAAPNIWQCAKITLVKQASCERLSQFAHSFLLRSRDAWDTQEGGVEHEATSQFRHTMSPAKTTLKQKQMGTTIDIRRMATNVRGVRLKRFSAENEKKGTETSGFAVRRTPHLLIFSIFFYKKLVRERSRVEDDAVPISRAVCR